MERQRVSEGLGQDQKGLITINVFKGQLTPPVLSLLDKSDILVSTVPANMTKYYQSLDHTVNDLGKRFLAEKFNEWYSNEMFKQLGDGKHIECVYVKLLLSILIPLHAGWIVELYYLMTTPEGQKIIFSRWRASGIEDAVRLGLNGLPSIYPINDIDPVLDLTFNDDNVQSVGNLTEAEMAIGYARPSEESDEVMMAIKVSTGKQKNLLRFYRILMMRQICRGI